jgi:hypothetical protein
VHRFLSINVNGELLVRFGRRRLGKAKMLYTAAYKDDLANEPYARRDSGVRYQSLGGHHSTSGAGNFERRVKIGLNFTSFLYSA